MPTFPQHRNMKKAAPPKESREPETNVTDQTNNLPAISDLVSVYIFFTIIFKNTYILKLELIFFQLGSLVKKRRVE